jgi:hypothetical protein
MTAYEIILTAVSTAVMALVGVGITAFTNWISTKTKNAKMDKYIGYALDAVYAAVSDVMQTYVDDIKASGKLTEEQKEEAKQKALVKVKNIMSVATYKALGEAYGDVEQWLQSNIQAEVKEQKVPKAVTK